MTPASVFVTLALDLVDALRHEANRVDDGRQIDADHVGDRFAHVECFEHREGFGVLFHQRREAIHDLHALPGRDP